MCRGGVSNVCSGLKRTDTRSSRSHITCSSARCAGDTGAASQPPVRYHPGEALLDRLFEQRSPDFVEAITVRNNLLPAPSSGSSKTL
jgi:hypothetical protein